MYLLKYIYNTIITTDKYIHIILQYQRTPLHTAIYKDNILLVKVLISFGADVNATVVSCMHILNYVCMYIAKH